MFLNRDGYTVEISPVERVEIDGDYCAISLAEPGWGTFTLTMDELDGFLPQVGDVVVTYMRGTSIRGVAIDGRVFRYTTPAQAEAEREQWKKNLRLERLEEYVKHGDELKARAAALPLPLRQRMERFAEADGAEFWIENAGYEMCVLEGAAALLRKVCELGYIHSSHANFGVAEGEDDDIAGAIKWIEDWWNLNSKEGNYDYKRQMELVPDFGDGHSGFTASSAKHMAVAILRGEQV